MPEITTNKKTEPAAMGGAPKRMAIRPLKTYRGDVEEVIQRQKESLAQIALAEQQKKAAEKKEKTLPSLDVQTKKRIFVAVSIVISVVVVTGGTFAALRYTNFSFSLWNKNTGAVTQTIITVPAIIRPDYEHEVDMNAITSKENVATLVRGEAAQVRNSSSILNIFFTRASTPPLPNVAVGKQIVSAGAFLTGYFGNAPDTLARSLNNNFMLGVYYDSAKKGHPFLILTTSSFETSFAAMLSWERTLPQDMGPLIGSSEGVGDFKDIVIYNKDTRSLLDRNGEPVFIYSFIDRNTILVAPDKETFGSIINLLNQQKETPQ
jgi:hypothetical protein